LLETIVKLLHNVQEKELTNINAKGANLADMAQLTP
jgi:hypothetical protein